MVSEITMLRCSLWYWVLEAVLAKHDSTVVQLCRMQRVIIILYNMRLKDSLNRAINENAWKDCRIFVYDKQIQSLLNSLRERLLTTVYRCIEKFSPFSVSQETFAFSAGVM